MLGQSGPALLLWGTGTYMHAGQPVADEDQGDLSSDLGEAGGDDESALIAAVRAGDQDAVGVLYGMYREEALGLARGLMRDGHDAEDVFQEAFTKTMAAMSRGFGPNENFLAYLYTAVRATAAGWWKTSQREPPIDSGDLETGKFGGGPGHDDWMDAALNDGKDHQRIIAALQTLPKRWQVVLWHADVLQDKPRHIAPVLGIAPNAVSALILRARNGLRKAYLELPDDNASSATLSAGQLRDLR